MKTTSPLNLSISKVLIGLLSLAFCVSPSFASDIKLQAYEAQYSLYIAGLHVGKSKLSLTQSNNLWRWQTSSKPRGIYRMLSDKKPYSETTFSLVADRHLIQNILLSDEGDKNLYETARFDWQGQQAQILRKKATSTAKLEDDVYDYHSINWLTAIMMESGETRLTVDFYTKGQVVKSTVKRIDNQNLETDGKSISAWVYEQSTALNKSKLKYYFDPAKPLLPIKIEKLKPGKKTAILLLQSVKWF